jgi:SAM-dependent methyltransferase
MTAKPATPVDALADDRRYDGPPDYRQVGRHDLSPSLTHDEIARFNFLAHMNRHLATRILPGVGRAYESRVRPDFHRTHGRDFSDRQEVRRALLKDPAFQVWSALRRNTMESRQQAGRSVVLRQAARLNARSAELTRGDPRLVLDPTLQMPRYIAAVDNHCMPGSYYTELWPEDISAAANYDAGLFVTTGGALGRLTDGAGWGLVQWMREHHPDFKPRRILDIGCGLGHSVLPIAMAYPDAEVVGVDVAAPMLRYGLARAKSLGVTNIRFVQANAESLPQFEAASFDWIQSTMFLHETSYPALQAIFRETFRLLAPRGFVLHAEQPQYSPEMPLYEQALRDWDAFYNNEPFWTRLHEIDLDAFMVRAGFAKADLLHGGVEAIADPEQLRKRPALSEAEDYGRRAAWHITGARKHAATSEQAA